MRRNKKLEELLEGKNVLYIATKNRDYIRVSQEIELIENYSNHVDVIAFNDKGYLRRIIKSYWKLIFINTRRYDVIFVGFMAQMIVPFLRLKFRNKLVITDFFISVYDTLVDDRKKIKAGSLLGKLFKVVDKKTINLSNYIIADTNAHGKYFISEFGAKKEKVLTLYLQADSKIYYPMESKRPDKFLGKYLVLYFGSILPVQGIEVILKSIDMLKDNLNIHFIMIGPIGEKYNKPKLENVTYIEWMSQEELAYYIAFSDLCLGGHFSSTIGKAKRTIPGKVYIYEAMKKKIILGDSMANHELYDSSDMIYYVEMGNAERLAECITNVFKKDFWGDVYES